jgi:hypothetical protein
VSREWSGDASGISIELSSEQLCEVLSRAMGRRYAVGVGLSRRRLVATANGSLGGVEGSGLSRSLLRGLRVLAAFPETGEGRGVGEVAVELEMTRTTTHRYISALVEIGLLEQEPITRIYRIKRS